MNYEIHMAMRNVYMRIFRKKCSTCVHYDGTFGDDSCFSCERSIRAVNYERRRSEEIF